MRKVTVKECKQLRAAGVRGSNKKLRKMIRHAEKIRLHYRAKVQSERDKALNKAKKKNMVTLRDILGRSLSGPF